MLDVNFEYFKELVDFWRKRSRQDSGKVQYAMSKTQFFLYLWTPEWKYRCVVNQDKLNRVEIMQYVFSGKRINGRIIDINETEDLMEIIVEIRDLLGQLSGIGNIQSNTNILRQIQETLQDLNQNQKRNLLNLNASNN